jgi:hypothetical protein
MAQAPKKWHAAGLRVLAIFEAARDRTAPDTPQRVLWDKLVADKRASVAAAKASAGLP